jgi:hypothetical protein
MRWSKSPLLLRLGWSKAPSNTSRNSTHNDFPTSYPVPPAKSPAVSNASHAKLSHAERPSRSRNPSHTATPVDGTFSPQRLHLRLDSHGYSPSVLAKVVHAGATLPSFELAARAIRLLADVSISGRHVGRLTEAIGSELVVERDRHAEAHRTRKLAAAVPNPPSVVAVEVDGGRYQRRAEGLGCGARDPHWREDKVACLVTLSSSTHEVDPQPEPPACFLDRERVRDVTQCPRGEQPLSADGYTPGVPEPKTDAVNWQPERLVRTCVATTQDSEVFGRLVGAEARARNFESATHRAFVADAMVKRTTGRSRSGGSRSTPASIITASTSL